MQISKFSLWICALALGGVTFLHAQDTPAQAAARQALAQKMSELEANPAAARVAPTASATPVAPTGMLADPVPAPTVIPINSALEKKAQMASAAAAKANADAQTQAMVASQAKTAALKATDTAAQAKAEAQRLAASIDGANAAATKAAEAATLAQAEAQKQAEAAAMAKAAALKANDDAQAATAAVAQAKAQAKAQAEAQAAARREEQLAQQRAAQEQATMAGTVSASSGSVANFQPLAAPPLTISLAKQEKLQMLLAVYKADKITSIQYQKERAAILAAP